MEKKIRSPKVRRQRLKGFESRLSGFVNKEEKQGRGSWMSKERGCRRNCETLRSSRSYRRKSIQSGRKAGLQQQLQDIEQKRHDLLLEHQRVQKTSQHPKKRNSKGKDPWTFEENSQDGDPSTP